MEKKIVAEFKRWNGKIEKRKVKKSWIDDIVFAVEGQFNVINKRTGLSINGGEFAHVDIYEVEEE